MRQILILLTGLVSSLQASTQTYREMMNNPEAYNFYDLQAAAEAHFDVVGRGQGSGYKQYMRWAIFNEPRAYPNGKIENWNYKNIEAYREYVQSDCFRNLPAEKTHNGYWIELEPTNWTNQNSNAAGIGRINVLAFHPTNTSLMWAGAPLGGLWRTDDAGATWTPLTDGMPNSGVSGIAVDPNNTNIIYILTGDGDGRDARSTGVLKTIDGGVTWKTTGLNLTVTNYSMVPETNLPGYAIRGYKLSIDPSSTNILFAATTSGLHRTTDGGNTWTTVSTGNFRNVIFRPGDSSVIYATTTGSFQRSTDGGTTWTTITSGLPTSSWSRCAIGVTAANPQMVYLLYGCPDGVGFRGLYRSTNGGTDFTVRSNTPNIFSGTQDGSGTEHQAWFDIAIAVSPTDANLVYMGGINMWRSTNGGIGWGVMTEWRADIAPVGKYVHSDIHFLGFRTSTSLWVGCDGGVFRTNNPSATSPV